MIQDIFEDHNGIIWVRNTNGFFKITGNSLEYVNLPKDTDIKAVEHVGVTAIDSSNTFFFVCSRKSRDKRSVYTFQNGVYNNYSSEYPALDSLDIQDVIINDKTNNLLLLTSQHIFYLWSNHILRRIDKGIADLINHKARNIVIVLRQDGAAGIFDGKSIIPTTIQSLNNKYGFLPEINNGKEVYFDVTDSIRVNFPFIPRSSFIDRENSLWITQDKGLVRVTSAAFSSFNNEDAGLSTIWAIGNDKNNHIWLGSYRGGELVEFDGKKFVKHNEFKKLFPSNAVFYKGSRTMSNGDIWFSLSTGILVWNGSTFSRLKEVPLNCAVCYIYEDCDEKKVMIGTDQGLLTISNNSVTLDERFMEKEFGIIEGIVKDRDGFYWLSGHKGLVKMKGRVVERIRQPLVPDLATFTILKDSRGGIWVTSFDGLFYKPYGSEKFNTGLPAAINTSANSIIEMDNDHLLIGRMTDICIIDLPEMYEGKSDFFRLYDLSDGFEGNECMDNGIIKDKSGDFWILTSDKVIKLDRSKLKPNIYPPVLNFTSLVYMNDSLNWVPVPGYDFFYSIPSEIVLVHKQRTIKISYSGISSTNPEKVTYRYMMEGYDDKWSLPSGQREKIYEKLPPGKYIFRLKAINADGVETANALEMHLTVKPEFWQTRFFNIAIILLAVSLIILFTWLSIDRSNKRKKKYDDLVSEVSRMQMELILKQFDPHFTFNVISSVGTMILKEQRETAYEYITKLAGLLRTVLDDGSPVTRPLNDELEFVKSYCELTKLRFKEKFTFNIKVDDDVDLSVLVPKMIIQSFVENSIKHGFENVEYGGIVDVYVEKADNALIIKIIDNGSGMEAAATGTSRGTGKGIKIIHDLFDEMNAGNERKANMTINYLASEGRGQGTEAVIIIPDNYQYVFRIGKIQD